MQIENLTPNQVGPVEDFLREMQKSNPQLTWVKFPMGVAPPHLNQDPGLSHHTRHVVHPEISADTTERLLRLEEKIDALYAKLNLIFGDQVLLNGHFVSVNYRNAANNG